MLYAAIRPGHINTMALLTVANDVFLSLIKGDMSILVLLYFSSAFGTIDYSVLYTVSILTMDLLILSLNRM